MTRFQMRRRSFIQTSLAAGAGMTAAGSLMGRALAASDNFPSRRMEAIIPFSPGGGTDRSVRVVAPAWAEALGTEEFQLNHSPGAGSLIAQNELQGSEHDGHTVLFTPAPHTAWLTELRPEDFSVDQIAWIGSYFQDPNVLLVQADSPYETAEQFLDAAANSDRTFTASVSSPMSAAHAATVVLRERAGVPIRVVPFEGGSEARNAVAGGHVDCCMAPYWSALHVLDLTRALVIFWPEDPTTGLWDAPPANEVLPFDVPDLHEPYAAQVSTQTAQDYPDRYERLISTFEEALQSKTFRSAAEAQDLTPFVDFWEPQRCQEFIGEYLNLLAEFRAEMEADLEEM